MPNRRSIQASLAKLAAAEDQFLQSQFLAPVAGGTGGSQHVQVQIAGIRCSLTISPADFTGWGVFKPDNHRSATLARPATFAERQRYLDLFPSIPLIVCLRHDADCRALPASRGDSRIAITGLLPVRLIEDVQPFDTIRARFDGSQFWFDAPDARSDPSMAAFLRDALVQKQEPAQLARPGMSPEQSTAYALVFEIRRQQEVERARHTSEGRIKEALSHAAAELRDFAELGDAYRVTFTVDGQRHSSVVRKNDLSVQAAGICLSGEDAKFDLHSLVGVIREGADGHLIRQMRV